MSDCSVNAWKVPAEREPGVLYMHGNPSTDYAAVTAIEVDGQRFERVTRCENCRYEYKGMCMFSDGCGDFRREYVNPEDFCSDGEPKEVSADD